MVDYDVYLVHPYWMWHTSFQAEDEEQVDSLIILRLQEENIPMWFLTSAQEIKIEKVETVTPL